MLLDPTKKVNILFYHFDFVLKVNLRMNHKWKNSTP
jgi:hypothetical protein